MELVDFPFGWSVEMTDLVPESPNHLQPSGAVELILEPQLITTSPILWYRTWLLMAIIWSQKKKKKQRMVIEIITNRFISLHFFFFSSRFLEINYRNMDICSKIPRNQLDGVGILGNGELVWRRKSHRRLLSQWILGNASVHFEVDFSWIFRNFFPFLVQQLLKEKLKKLTLETFHLKIVNLIFSLKI